MENLRSRRRGWQDDHQDQNVTLPCASTSRGEEEEGTPLADVETPSSAQPTLRIPSSLVDSGPQEQQRAASIDYKKKPKESWVFKMDSCREGNTPLLCRIFKVREVEWKKEGSNPGGDDRKVRVTSRKKGHTTAKNQISTITGSQICEGGEVASY